MTWFIIFGLGTFIILFQIRFSFYKLVKLYNFQPLEKKRYKSTTGMNTITPELPARHSIMFPIQQRRQFALISLFILILCVEHYDQIILNILTGICTIFFSSCSSVKISRKGYFVSICIHMSSEILLYFIHFEYIIHGVDGHLKISTTFDGID